MPWRQLPSGPRERVTVGRQPDSSWPGRSGACVNGETLLIMTWLALKLGVDEAVLAKRLNRS